MSGSGRKLSSKWDSRDDPEFSPESVANSNNSRWSYMESNNKLKPRMGFSCKEHFSGGRGSSKDEEYKVFDATFVPDNGGSYDLKMSPRFEERKNKNHSHFSKDDYSRSGRSRSRSRSRSCSPPHGLQWNAGVNSRNRTRAGGLTKPCRDFAVGNCRRGSHCYFLHEDNHSYEDSRESRHRQDGAPRYSTPHESGDYSRASGRSNEACINFAKGRCRTGASGDDSYTERDIDRKSIENSFRQGGRHYANHNINIPCKFFAFGNCRNGKDCRFSHDSQAIRSPNRRLRDDRLRSSQDEEQALDRPKLSDSYSPNGRVIDRWGSVGSVAAEVDKDRDGPQQNDFVAVSDTTKLVEENKKGSMGAPEPGFIWPMSEGWDHSLDKNRVHNELPSPIDKKKANRWTADNAVDNSLVSQSVGRGIWPGDEKMSPDWNYGAKSSSHIKEEHGQNKQQVAPGQGLNQNAQNVTASHAAGQSQAAVSIAPPRARVIEGIQNHELSTENKYIVEPNIMNASLSQISSRNPPTPNGVSNEQLAQLSSLSASLAHILGTDRQLPQLHSTLNSVDAKETPFITKTEGSGNPVSVTSIKPDPAIGLKQYDTMCNSMEPKNTNTSGVPSTFSPSTKIPKNAVEIPQLLSNPGQSFDDSYKTAISEELVKNEHFVQSQQGVGIEVKKENNEMVAEEKPSSQTENKIKEDGPLENMDKSAGPVEEKKMKDVKVIRAFKNSLVEFIKELLKPTWKEGKINKEDFKAIVKKVTDKVTDTVEKKEIPQTQEKIDRYLSVSKPKLNKLVQAYVDKIQKP